MFRNEALGCSGTWTLKKMRQFLLLLCKAGAYTPSAPRGGPTRRALSLGAFGGLLWPKSAVARTNDVTATVEGIRRRRLGNSDIDVSELGIGTQRWGSTDFNGPDEALCHAMLDRAVASGVNLVDTAEQYPIPGPPEGRTEEIIGRWLKKNKRSDLVIASKITGGMNVNKKNIKADCEGSLKRLQTDYLDVYLLHWPQRYTPQANWGQSLEYSVPYGRQNALVCSSFDDVVEAMGELIDEGKIRGYGSCNDNAVGCMGLCAAADARGVARPLAFQNDYSLLNRRCEENGLSEACTLQNVGFMAYNVLAGGMLTGKYGLDLGDTNDVAAVDDPDDARASRNARNPRGRMDTSGWGQTLARYRTPAARRAAKQYFALATKAKMDPLNLALRFPAGRDAVTTSLVGHTSLAQLDASIAAFRRAAKAGLSNQLLWDIDRVHLQNRLPLFALDNAGDDWSNRGIIGERIP